MTGEIVSSSVEETILIGQRLAALLLPGDFIALTGELGAGKTQFAKGVATGLGVNPAIPVTSPTYTLLNIYAGRYTLYHFDLYRLHDGQEVLDLGFEEYFHGDGICLVEWAERLEELLPEDCLHITMSHAADDCRRLSFHWSGPREGELAGFLAAMHNEKMF